MFCGNERAGVDEQYQVAGNTSDLTVEADRRGAGDVMIAAGWNPSRVGMALLRLHSEWNALAKPKRATVAQIQSVAERLIREDEQARGRWGPPNPKQPKPRAAIARAKDESERWYANELRLMANGLKSRPLVWAQLETWRGQKGISSETVAEALLYWLDPTCRACEGRKLVKHADQPALTARVCQKCQGSGQAHSPRGTAAVLAHLDYCVSVARGSLRKRLRPGA